MHYAVILFLFGRIDNIVQKKDTSDSFKFFLMKLSSF